MSKLIVGLIIVLLIPVVYVAVTVASVGRFSTTHAIVRESSCIDCHMQELIDLNNSRHMGSHVVNVGNNQATTIDYYIDMAQSPDINGVCMSCHNNRRNLFGIVDPHIFSVYGNNTSIFNGVVLWNPDWEMNITNGGQNETITVTIGVQDIIPENESVAVDASVILMNISGMQNESKLTTGIMGGLGKGDSKTIFIQDIYGDYFWIRMSLSGKWNFSSVNVSVSGYPVSVINSTDGWSGVISLSLPVDLPLQYSYLSLFHTQGNYTVKRLDRVIEDMKSAAVTSISTNEIMKFRNDSRYTCGVPGAMCHINNKMTFLGQTFGFKSGRYYAHEIEYVTAKTCKACHI